MNDFQDSFRDNLIDSYSQTRERTNLFKPAAEYIGCDFDMRLPKYEITSDVKGGKTRVLVEYEGIDTFSPDRSYGTSVVLTDLKKNVIPDKLLTESFKHDFTFSVITESTDISLKNIFYKTFGDHYDNLTPDYSFRHEDTVYVVEFTTRHSGSPTALKESFDLKNLKYSVALNNRLTSVRRLFFLIIVVGTNGLYTNIKDLDRNFVKELVFRYKLSISLFKRLVELQIIVSENTLDQSVKEKEVKRILNSLPRIEDINCDEQDLANCDGLVWSKSIYNKICEGSYNLNEANKKIGTCLRKSIDEVKNSDPPIIKYTNSNYQFLCKDQKELQDKFLINSKDLINNSTGPGRRTHLKAPVQLPFLDIEPGNFFDNSMETLPGLHQVDNQGMYKIWMDACYDAGSRLDDFDQFKVPDALKKEDWERIKVNFKGTEKLARSKYHRVVVPIPDDHKVELACVGVAQEKHAFKLPGVSDYRSERKEPFPIDIDTTDISKFLDEFDCTSIDLPDSIHCMIPNGQKTLNLIAESVNLHKGTPDHIKISREIYLKMFFCSKIGRYSSFVSDLAFELNLSLKQHCKPKEFILKKLARFPVWLLIKPTNSASHTFFSMLISKENVNNDPNAIGCFKRMTEYDEHWISDFVSVSMSKLTNWLTTESRMLNCLAHFMEYHRIQPCSEEVFIENDLESTRKVWRDVKLCLMIQLSDKDEVENELTRLRYTIMEGFVNYPVYPNPGKMLAKINTRPKSRLTCFLIMKAITSMDRIHDGFYFHRIADSENAAVDKSSNWRNLFHPIFMDPISNPGDLINLFYLGYMNNKNKTSEKNIEGNLYVKILDMEKKFWVSVDKNVTGLNKIGVDPMETMDDGYHLYDPDVLTHVTKHFIKVGDELHSGQFLKEVENDILHRLSHLSIENSLTTLKASSNFNETLETYVRDQKYSRSKVIQNTMKIIEDEIMVIELLPKCLQKLESKNCLHIDIFKKPQFGDFREIYVMGIEERVCQLIIETISRSICSLFKSETMTNPNSKTALPELHSKITNLRFKGGQCVIVGTSDDAEKWNQTHYVSKFYHFLIMLTPVYMHGIIQRILRLWMHKKIKISQILLDLFEKNTNLNIENETIQEMWGIHQGKVGNQVYQRHGNSFLKIRTGMMQGILHYTSSVLHTILQEYAKSLAQSFIDSNLEGDNSSVCTIMQSSDDSSMLLSISFDKDLGYLKALKLSSIVFKTKNKIGKFLGIYPSIKSTSNTPFVMEFNSQFFFDSSKYMPYIKTVFSSCLISEQESLQSRQEELNGLITDLISNGGSFSLASTVQASQALLYYRLLGSSVNMFFSSFCDEILKYPDPASGFFLMDCPLFCGISGFRYNIWNACLTSGLGRLYSSLLHKDDNINNVILTDTGKVVDFDTYHAGSLVRKIILPFGSRKKWFNMIESSNLNPDWEEIIDRNPEILYRSAKTSDELDLKFAIKLHSPGVTKSFDVTNILPRIVSSSTYLLNYEILEPISAWYTQPSEPEQNPIKLMANQAAFMISDSQETVTFYKGTSSDDHLMITSPKIMVTTKEDLPGVLFLFTRTGLLSGDDVSKSFLSRPDKFFAIQSAIITDVEESRVLLVRFNDASSPVTRINNIIRSIEDTLDSKGFLRHENKSVKLSLHNLIECNISIRKLILAIHKHRVFENLHFVFQIGEPEEADLFFPSSHNRQGEGIEYKSRFSLLDIIYENEEVAADKALSEDDIKFLFPYNEDYLSLRELLLHRNTFHIRHKTYERRKVSTKLQVYDAEHNQMFSPDRIIGSTWFPLSNVPASEKVVKMLFDQLQSSIKWLSDDPDVSKAQSPFKTHMQLQNWLARSDMSKRIVRIMGAPLVSRSGTTNLLNAVCLDYSSGFELTVTEHKSSYVPVSQDIKHLLYMLSICPLKTEAKTDIIFGLLSGFHTIPYQSSKLKSRMNTLSCIQSLTRREDMTNILFKMKKNKLGVAGSFEVRQEYCTEDKRYYGPGVWKGIINGIDARILIASSKHDRTYVDGIILSSDVDLKDFLISLQDWLADNNLVLGEKVPNPSNSENLFKKYYRGASLMYSINMYGLTVRSEGVPVYSSREMPKFDLQFTHESTDLELIGNNLYLVMTANKVKTRVLKYPVRSKDFLSNYRESGDDLNKLKSVLKSFVSNQSLSEQDSLVFLSCCASGEDLPPQLDRERVQDWLHEIFLGNLVRSDLISRSHLSAPDSSEVNDSSVEVDQQDFIDMMDMIEDLTDTLDIGINDLPPIIEDTDVTELWQDTFELGPEFLSSMGLVEFGEDEPSMLVNAFSVLRQSRLISKWFLEATENFGTKALRDLINRGHYTQEMKETGFLDIYCYLNKVEKTKLTSKLDLMRRKEIPERTISDLF